MCFSAQASFIAGGGLLALGGVTFAIAKKENKMLATFPLLFGIQQISEGIQWLNLNAGTTSPAAGYFFLFFALIVWPLYVPVFVFVLDEKRKKRILKWFIFLGAFVAFYFSWLMLTESIVINKVNACIRYGFNSPLEDPIFFFYLTAIFGSLFISGHRAFRWYGATALFFAAISWIFFTLAFTSVWCFFAAILSVIFLVYAYRPNLLNFRQPANRPTP